MKDSKIEFCSDTWNPLSGCLYDCQYCSARGLANRFGGHKSMAYYMAQDNPIDVSMLRILNEPMKDEVSGKVEPFPFYFGPTYYRYRLPKLKLLQRPGNIFICSTGDLFGDWVDNWIVDEIISHAAKHTKHNYLFLTKNPIRYDVLESIAEMRCHHRNMLFGATIDSQVQADAIINAKVKHISYLCIEPILTEIDLEGFLRRTLSKIEWVILGAENGNRQGKVIPEDVWVKNISNVCYEYNIPLFVKRGYTNKGIVTPLERILGNAFRQDYPEQLRRNARPKKLKVYGTKS